MNNKELQDESYGFTEQDLFCFAERGITPMEVERQIKLLRSGTPYLNVHQAATTDRGIMVIDDVERIQYLHLWHDYLLSERCSVLKFIPASGAASRMFKPLYQLNSEQTSLDSLTEEQKQFFENIDSFAFYSRLSETCLRNHWKTVGKMVDSGQFYELAQNLLSDDGLNYGSLPKAMLQFHKYSSQDTRTPIGEHLAEGVRYIKDRNGLVRLHFTVSPEHQEIFKGVVDRATDKMSRIYGAHFDVNYSLQKTETDTVTLSLDNKPRRDEEGNLIFRAGGHGALISNMNELDAEVVFIKNIDNVQPEHLKCDTVISKQLLGGILIALRNKVFSYLKALKRGKVSRSLCEEMVAMLDNTFCISMPPRDLYDDDEYYELLFSKFNRPIRVCGMVKNEGEPGGGPYIINELDKTSSLQILEASQINQSDPEELEKMKNSEYFNPVDLCCLLVNFEGERFNLMEYVNEYTSFISHKSLKGQEFYALERPGLWNGAMDQWNTVFVEVPSSTFTPVKTVNDLLRDEHQAMDTNN